MANLPKAKAGNEWTEWKGGECPVPKGTKVDVIYRNGAKESLIMAPLNVLCSWGHLGGEDDIVAYRLSWIRHRGGKHPGKPRDKFEVRFRDGSIGKISIFHSEGWNRAHWLHLNNSLDIMAYRPVI
ncbi:hypothetical protein FBPa8_0015 [Pseudomonas phage vB_PaeP_FBPa8]|nr:hypothetical protein FBPa8_0015 [Pseudomonas phage vB_PaeP_FBPa8]